MSDTQSFDFVPASCSWWESLITTQWKKKRETDQSVWWSDEPLFCPLVSCSCCSVTNFCRAITGVLQDLELSLLWWKLGKHGWLYSVSRTRILPSWFNSHLSSSTSSAGFELNSTSLLWSKLSQSMAGCTQWLRHKPVLPSWFCHLGFAPCNDC